MSTWIEWSGGGEWINGFQSLVWLFGNDDEDDVGGTGGGGPPKKIYRLSSTVLCTCPFMHLFQVLSICSKSRKLLLHRICRFS